MNDPSKIPQAIRALEAAWLGNADQPLLSLMSMLEARGLTWQSSIDDTISICTALAQEFPGRLTGTPDGYAILCESPDREFLITATHVIVRGETPTAWEYSSLMRAEVGLPLRIADAADAAHKFGVVRRITAMGERRYQVLIFSDGLGLGCRTPDGHTTLWLPQRRDTRTWQGRTAELQDGILRCELGELRVATEHLVDVPLTPQETSRRGTLGASLRKTSR
ncbi:hypothetical protein NQ015_03005 [Corynebacterium sp. 153RC1]|uniref:hypothetical protein n=1 Tax=unclassified Corynebacterium TaxID=2624378 RepID=UPI00211BAB6F|nr:MULTISPECIES: hypothetical protein [unclassified Corynebacterium]MCQ9370066.1 hypothetical protein [Corynebacterium sp. 35RC1]MCQ9351840.1 hypothetical protein [Corynebacterium sp. 209RC1]MCQ9354997.1 hypothetical protein [Corynebacterium sp. 1222RC1]MCQ9356122.1 hypothetical protein [Corynebacterium sp. 122RC1]MCQ9359517.1 hypothetical protein [Corynebacterium sp. 142RC1]